MAENTVRLIQTMSRGGKIEYRYEVSGVWRACFRLDEPFTIEYGEDIGGVPESVAVIPFLCAVLPMAWVCGAKIYVAQCDADFARSIPEFKKGYERMYPMISFGGSLEPERLVENGGRAVSGSAAFFSGGVDAFSTLISHYGEKPVLITLWGADVPFEDAAGWEKVRAHLAETAREFGVEALTVKTAFRRFLNEPELNRRVAASGDNWWHGFQHGIGIISHAAPCLYIKGLERVYIASSFCPADQNVTGASYPTIDNYVRFCGCKAIHDGFENNRQDKVRNICNFSREKDMAIPLRVCWESPGGGNCCKCEKCARTMLAIESERADPARYGFTWDAKTKRGIRRMLLYRETVKESRIGPVQRRMRETHTSRREIAEWGWFMNSSVERMNSTLRKRLKKTALADLLRPLKHRLTRK